MCQIIPHFCHIWVLTCAHNLFLPIDALHIMIISAKIPMLLSAADMQKDLQKVSLNWAAHFNMKHYEGSWTGLPLRSVGGGDSIIPGLTAEDVFEDHPNMDLFPSVKKILANMNCKMKSVRLLNLAPGAVIKPHCDAELSFEQGEVRLHIPVVTNADVEFYVHGQRVTMQEGECWYINANLKHQVTNAGKTARIHLVIDCKVNEWLHHLMQSVEIISHAPDYTIQELNTIIRELRIQNTVKTNQLADEFQKRYAVSNP